MVLFVNLKLKNHEVVDILYSNFCAMLRSGGPSLRGSAAYPKGFASFVADCYMEDRVAWLHVYYTYSKMLLEIIWEWLRLLANSLSLICHKLRPI